MGSLSALTLDDYQRSAAKTDVDPDSRDPLVPLLGLGGEVGALLTEFKKKTRADGVDYTGFDDAVATELGDILWYLATLARRSGLTLSEVADRNLRKTVGRWLPPSEGRPPFDADFPDDQRLPRTFEVSFAVERPPHGHARAQMRIAGEEVGDPIDDNSRLDDHYRFHDVFHLAYAAVLGWSPILRSLLKRKRKTDALIDRVEDGARARATEEAIAALVFQLAKPYDYFAGFKDVDDEILSTVAAVASGLEVKDRTQAEWERAILLGFSVWRELRDRDEAVLRVDLDAGEITIVG